MRDRAEAVLRIDDIMQPLDEEARRAVAFEVFRCYGGPLKTRVSGKENTSVLSENTDVFSAGHVFSANGGATGGSRRASSPKGKNLELEGKALEVLGFLNEKTGRSFRPVEENLRFIRARLATCSVEDCKGVIARKTRVWKGTTQDVFLRPKTLFNATNFEQYIGEQPHD